MALAWVFIGAIQADITAETKRQKQEDAQKHPERSAVSSSERVSCKLLKPMGLIFEEQGNWPVVVGFGSEQGPRQGIEKGFVLVQVNNRMLDKTMPYINVMAGLADLQPGSEVQMIFAKSLEAANQPPERPTASSAASSHLAAADESAVGSSGTTTAEAAAAPAQQSLATPWREAPKDSDPLRVIGLSSSFRVLNEVGGELWALGSSARVCRLWRDTVAATPLAVSPLNAEDFITIAEARGAQVHEVELTANSCDFEPIIGDALMLCSSLVEISLADSNCADCILVALGTGCPALETVDLMACTACTDDGVRELVSGCHKLQWLNLQDCYKIGDASLAYIGECCPELQWLSIRGCPSITNGGVGWLAQDCPQLEVLNMMDCAAISNAGCIEIARHCPHLKSLNVSGCGITDQGVTELAQCCAGLVTVDLSRCTQITDTVLRVLSSQCQLLECLWLQSCSAISDTGLLELASSSSKLVFLSIEGCDNVTEKGVAAVLEGCNSLEILYLQLCPQINHDALQEIIADRSLPEGLTCSESSSKHA